MIWEPIDPSTICPAHSNLTACSSFAYVYLNLLVSLYGDANDRRIQEELRDQKYYEDIDDDTRYELEGERDDEYDFIVVGAGAAGCVVANRLTENHEWKVLLLEAGPEEPDITLVPALSTALLGSNIDYKYQTEPNGRSCLAFKGGRCDWPRGRMMGGSSSINSMAYIRGNRLDYDNWAAMGNEGWSYEDVLPYFKKSEDNLNIEGLNLNPKFHGIHGPQPVSRFPYIDDPSIMLTEAFHEGGLPILDYNGEHQTGTMQAQDFSENGQRVSTNNAYIQPIRYIRKNLTVKSESVVIKILFDEHKRAYGVKYVRNGEIHTAIANKEIIVSGGTINSPQLLMLSGIGPKEHLEELNIPVIQDLAVGYNLHDHVTFNGIVIALNKTATTVSQEEILTYVEEFKYEQIHRGPLSGNGPVNSVSFIKTEPNLPAPDIEYQVNSANWKELYEDPVTFTKLPLFPTAFYDAVVPRTMNLVPKSRGRLVLNATDPYGHPLLFPNYFGDPDDLLPIIKGVKFLISLENTDAFKSRGAKFVKEPLKGCEHLEWGSDEFIVCLAVLYTSSPYHPVGTCKMGPKWDRNAVVDPRLRVYGVSGLRVIDASIMPVAPRGNTNAPSNMVGERGVALVIEDWMHNYVESEQ